MGRGAGQKLETGGSDPFAQLYPFLERVVEERVKQEIEKLRGTLNDRAAELEQSSKDELRAGAERVRDQILTALALFASFFTLMSSATLAMVKSPTALQIVLIITTVSTALIVFLALFFTFLHDRLPKKNVIWLPVLMFAALWLLVAVAIYYDGPSDPTIRVDGSSPRASAAAN